MAVPWLVSTGPGCTSAVAVDKLTYHSDAQRSGWNPHERVLTPLSVAGPAFGLRWQTPILDYVEGVPPRVFATPLYVNGIEPRTGSFKGRRISVLYVISSTGFAYAINATASGPVEAGTILWRKRLTGSPCAEGTMGNLSTPVIDPPLSRIYVTSCEGASHWQAHALDLRDGEEQSGWPVAIDAQAVNVLGLNHNGTTRFRDQDSHFQRGALNLSPDRARLYVTFGFDDSSGWLIAIDTRAHKVAAAFSSTARTEEIQGGMWSSGGPSVDRHGKVYIATGASSTQMLRHAGIPGVFPDSPHSWGQSILQFTDSGQSGLTLIGTYTPFNYCVAAANDVDLGSSGTLVLDLDPRTTKTPHLLALGGGKQGNAYLLDTDRMPGGVTQRHPCSEDAASDLSLLAPDPQPQFGTRGPLNVFGPYTDQGGSFDQAHSRSTAAFYQGSTGENFLFVTGSSKRTATSSVSTAPGLVKLRIVAGPTAPAYLQIEKREETQIFQNPGSPVVTSNGHDSSIVWVLDTNAPRTATLYGPHAPQPVLYAFDATDLRLLWKSKPGVLPPGGKYNEPTVVNGTVYLATDRVQAFGLDSQPARADGGPYRDFELHLRYRFRGPAGSANLVFRSDTTRATRGRAAAYVTRLGSPATQDLFVVRRTNPNPEVAPLALIGERTDFYLRQGEPHKEVLGLVNEPGTVTASLRPYPDWNEYVLLVSGNRFAQAVNGLLVNDTTDDDFEGRADTGGFSLHFDAAGRSGIEVAAVKLTRTSLLFDWNQRFATHPRRVPSALTAQQARVFQAGSDIYRQRCAACHGNPQSGAPPMQSLAQFPAGRITDVLTNGLMRDMAAGLTDEDKRSVALFLTTQSAETP